MASIAACCLNLAVPAVAQTTPYVVPYVGLDADSRHGGWSPQASDLRLAADGKSWELISPAIYTMSDLAVVTVQELRFDADPIVYNSTLVQNISGLNQTYTLAISLNTTFGAPNQIRGSIDTSVIGLNATLATVPGFSIYSAQIDGVTVKTLQNDVFSLSTPNAAVSSSASFGFEASNVPVNSNFGILLKFELTPGATAAIISDFEIAPAVPEPSTLALSIMSAGILFLRRQRR